MRKPRSKNLVIFLLCFVLLALFEPFGYTSAYADVNRSISDVGGKTADVDDAGNLRFEVRAHAASSGTRWKTVGLLVTYNPTVFHLVPDDAPTAFTENFKLPAVSISAVLLLPADILLFAA